MSLIPTDTVCPVCSTIFQQPIREQGEGSRKIYCSHACASLDWIRNHPIKRRANVIKYDSKPENRERKNELQRLRKYGLTKEEFLFQLTRQNFLCLGCNDKIDIKTSHIDHNHQTGKFRGLLCGFCNTGLGLLKEKREILYKLSAYLSYDRTKPSIYVIGSLRNPITIEISNALRKAGIEVWDNWYSAGPEADDYFQKYFKNRGFSFEEALKQEAAQHIFYYDKAHLDLCDFAVLLYPAGKSCHLELGYMAGRNKRTFILLDKEPERYELMPQFAYTIVKTADDLIKEIIKQGHNNEYTTIPSD
jgi:hypothetical protein